MVLLLAVFSLLSSSYAQTTPPDQKLVVSGVWEESGHRLPGKDPLIITSSHVISFNFIIKIPKIFCYQIYFEIYFRYHVTMIDFSLDDWKPADVGVCSSTVMAVGYGGDGNTCGFVGLAQYMPEVSVV